MPKKLSEDQKKNIIQDFIKGISIVDLAEKYNFTKLTITRHLKKSLTEKKFKGILKNNKNQFESNSKNYDEYEIDSNQNIFEETSIDSSQILDESFVEITPLNFEIDHNIQKDLSSISISDVNFPKMVYLIVDNKLELQTKFLRDYPDWQFLSQNELSRKTIEIYFDMKIAKSFCNKLQKVIKVPNTDVFRLAASKLLSKGISRIITPDKLIAL